MRLLAWLAMLCATGAALAEAPRSGYHYLGPETRALQDDAFANPGLLWVERGAALWSRPAGPHGSSCAGCHGEARASMRGVRARYPAFEPDLGKPLTLEQRINQCRRQRMGAAPWPWESDELLAITAFVGFQSRGLPVTIDVEGPLAPHFERGRAFWMRRRGQLDLACSQCHDQLAGRHLYGDTISQGQSNGFPAYRMRWQTLGSLQRMFRWCNIAVRAEPYPFGADAYVDLEVYLAGRGRGLPVETPAVRR